MNSKQLVSITKRVALLINHEYKVFNLKDEYQNNIDYEEDYESFLEGLTDKAQRIELTLMKNELNAEYLGRYVRESEYPTICFYEKNGFINPVVFYQKNAEIIVAYLYEGSTEIRLELERLDDFEHTIVTGKNNMLTYAIPFSLHPMVSTDDNLMKEVNTPIARLFNLLGAEKTDILYVYFYAIIVSFISLSLPVGIQAIIELISGGVVFNSIVLLIGGVIVAVLIAGILQVMQYTIVEILQRRVFVKASLELTNRMPRMRAESILGDYAPELMNRFFDVLTIQKGLPKLLVDLTGSVLQIFFGLLLLAFYHPFFVFFSLALIAALATLFYVTGPKGLSSSLIESKYKYKVAHWLEEIARTVNTFKLAGNTSLPIQKMDSLINNYLYYRKKHFRVLMIQFINIVGFKTVVTGGLLIIGSWLVIDRQITLGQFVATEIVIVLILNAVEKLILSIDTVYDMLTAVEKIGSVTDIELEKKGGITIPRNRDIGMSVKIRNLKYKYPGTSQYSLNGIDLDVKPGENVCIAGFNGSGKNTLLKVLAGILDSYDGQVSLNNISMKDINLTSLRDNIAKNFSSEDLFDGSILDNITMGKSKVSHQDAMWAIEHVGLTDYIQALPKGLMTDLTAGGKQFSGSIATRLVLARCIAERPQLLILDDIIHEISKEDRLHILQFLISKANPWSLLVLSNDPLTLAAVDRIVLLKEGKVVAEGTYNELISNTDFRNCIAFAQSA